MITSKPTKQRVNAKKARTHTKRKLMSSHLSKELRTKYKKRAVPVRSGDEVIIMRGSYQGLKGKVEQVKRKPLKVFIEGIRSEKKNGTKTKVGFNASNLMIISLKTSDAKRLKGENK